MVRRRQDLEDRDGTFRTGKPPAPTDKHPFVLQGPSEQVGSRDLRPRSVRMNHLAPDVKEALKAVTDGNNDNGRFWRMGPLLICTHRLTSLSSGNETWTFPRLFRQAPRVTATPVTNLARTATVSSVSAGQVTVHAWTDAGGTSNVNVDVVAIGLDS